MPSISYKISSLADFVFLGAKAPLGLVHVKKKKKKRGVMKKFQNSNILINSTHRLGYC